MDKIISVFKQLGVNESVVYQFLVVLVVYFLAKYLFLDHLQKLLDLREDKTVNLEGEAEEQFAQVEKEQQEYKEKMISVNKALKEKLDAKKAEVIKVEEAKYKKEEHEVNTYIEASRKEVEKEIADKKEVILKEAEQLSTNLVQRLTKGI